MLFDFRARAVGDELMDDFEIVDNRLRRALFELPRLNRVLGGYRPVRSALGALLRELRPISVLDLGTGIGDLPVRIVDWAHRAGSTAVITATDANPATVAHATSWLNARSPLPAGSAITVRQADAMRLPFADDAFDVVTASQLLHHFSDADITRVLSEMGRVARHRVIVSDLHRNGLAWLGIILVTNRPGFGRMVRSDGPLSVRKGFVRGELERLAAAAGLEGRVRWHPMFRWSLTASPILGDSP